MDHRRRLARTLAAALLSGPWDPASIEERAVTALGRRSAKRAHRLVEELLTRHPTFYAPSRHKLEHIVYTSKSFARLGMSATKSLDTLALELPVPTFEPIPPLRDLGTPSIATTGALASWLDVPLTHLDWLTDERRTLRRETRSALQHYEHAWKPKSDGTHRLIEAPKPRLREIQRRILREILDRLAPHDAAYGFVKNRSCATAAAKHAGEDVVVTVDLKNFFLNIPLARVHAIFRCLGYPYPSREP
jgi:hypothetical protein